MKIPWIITLVSVLLSIAVAVWRGQTGQGSTSEEMALRQRVKELEAEVARLHASGRTVQRPIERPGAESASLTPLNEPENLVNAGQGAEEVMARLLAASLNEEVPEAQSLRQMILQLERLVEMGPAAVPAIRDFLSKNEDVVFDGGGGPPPGKGKAKREAALPLSLRDGLIDALKRIGGAEAEALLAETLARTSRGSEVLALSNALSEVAPGRYDTATLTAARNLLANPAQVEAGTRADERSREYLFEVLARQGDPQTLAMVGAQIVTGDGTVDEAALKVFESPSSSAALDGIYNALADPRVTEYRDRERLIKTALRHVGAEERAGQLFYDVLQDATMDMGLRERALRHLVDEGLENRDLPSVRDQQVLRNRLEYLNHIRPSLTDERLLSEWQSSMHGINSLLSGQTPAPRPKGKAK